MSYLEVSVQKKLKKFRLDITFQADKGCLGILGASGCGKSMTLRSIAGTVCPDSGKIVFQDEERGKKVFFDSQKRINLAPQKRKTGYLFQNYALFPNMTVLQNITAGLKSRKMDRKKEREEVLRFLDTFQLTDLENLYPLQLSGGQQQRTALARMLISRPDILLFDEPFAALDSYLKEGLRLELLKILKEFGGISVLVTHDRDEVFQLCDRLLILDQGKAVDCGDTKEIFRCPKSEKAARITGCKNISRIRRINSRTFCAPDWGGIILHTDEPIGQEIRFAGIRAHSFRACSVSKAQALRKEKGTNLIPVEDADVSEMPFEWYITLKNHLWWKVEKKEKDNMDVNKIPLWLYLSPQDILLLRED